ncbi:AarF/ABC1/UbiB kinase family protein [Brachyspira innocens]|uniref:AarF/ABC1/UbiB kinase family protein n=1 Tax=Brachyspira innocens TaxID=13264 RepID=A0ABT8YZP5_9SPIR|nr:AarF/ABC1/UbiB kinase family protein [Brachyspira innocens]MDO6994730.1 AarF/ABC1/UbiB kinase family protein [Brachyspira innocens]MDO7020390.1 AarF/ABC1/UbiB kinase family protein [Brachyspira innocens]
MNNIKSINRAREIISIIMAYGFRDIIAITPILKIIKNPIDKINIKYKGIDLRNYSRGERIRMACEDLGTTFVKLGQILSNRNDILPKDITDELSKLQNHVKPFDENEAINIIETELGKKIDEVFDSFDMKPKASASISQVHTAVLKTGEKVAIKVKRPNIEENILMDIEVIIWLSNIIEKYNEEFALMQPQKLIAAFKAQLLQELDFNFEKNNTLKFARYFKDNKNIKIAKIYEEYSTKSILTMEYIDGIKISDISPDDNRYDRKKLVSIGIDAVLEQIFMLGFFHADPHPGNLMALENNVLCFLDFGMIGFIPPNSKEAFSSLIMSISSADYLALSKSILDLCYHSDIKNIDDFNMAIFVLVNKYIDMSLDNINIEDVFNELIEIIREFRLSLPSNIMLLIKSLIVLEGVARNLDKDVKLIEHIKPFAFRYVKEQIKPDNILKQLKKLVTDYSHILKQLPSDFSDLVSVMKKGSMKIQLEHKNLESLSTTLDGLADRLSYSIVLASLIMASALIITSKMPPLFHGTSVIGMIGFGLSAIMGFIMIISRFIKKYVKKR